MFPILKPVLKYGAVAIAAVLLVTTPPAAHGIAAALVQVVNTPSSPVFTQSSGGEAGDMVNLFTDANPTVSSSFTSLPAQAAFAVPGGQYLVITGVDILPLSSSCAAPLAVNLQVPTGYIRTWVVAPGVLTTHYDYPGGLALPVGQSPSVLAGSNAGCQMAIQMNGYLTSN